MTGRHTLAEDYRRQLRGSEALDRPRTLAGGASHDSWTTEPFAPVFARGRGPYKWDVDGRRYVDLWMGHGALLLGHGHPDVVRAVRDQAERLTHAGGSSDVSVAWARRVVEMLPWVDQVRFTASGTEATLLALRIARAATGRPCVLRVDGHFHGWHDEALAHLLDPATSGVPADAGGHVRVASPVDLSTVRDQLSDRQVACLIVEPGGGSSGSLPFDPDWLAELRRLATDTGTLLVFDEVMSGFRYAPGGAAELAGVEPDLVTLAKVLCGGLPGAAVAGRREVMEVLGRGRSSPHGHARAPHTGTFNGNPLSAAAGVATLGRVADGVAQRRAADAADALVSRIDEAAARWGLDLRAFARHSIFHLLVGAVSEDVPAEPSLATFVLQARRPEAYAQLRLALLLEGVDCHRSHGWLSSAHDAEALDVAAAGFDRAFERLSGLWPGVRT